jgi:hypothetical protein
MRLFVLALATVLLTAATPALAWKSGDSASDQEIAQRIAGSLTGSGQLKGYSIGVKYKEGTARLDGWVRNAEQMDAALALVHQHPDVANVVNNLTVRHEPAVTRAAPGKPETFQEVSNTAPLSGEESSPIADEAPQARYATPESNGVEAAAYPPVAGQRAGRPGMLPRQRMNVANRAQSETTTYPQPGPTAEIMPAPQGAPAPPNNGYAAYQGGHPAYQGGHPAYQMARQPGPQGGGPRNAPLPAYVPGTGGGVAPAVYDQPYMPNYAWPSYAAYPNYAQVTYPKQYSPAAWPYIGPFYPYPQVPLGWRKVTLEWDDGWWFLNFQDDRLHCCGH